MTGFFFITRRTGSDWESEMVTADRVGESTVLRLDDGEELHFSLEELLEAVGASEERDAA